MAAGAVWGGAFLFWGPATLARVYRQDEVARFAPTFHGVGQLLGETFLLALATYVGRRWLRIRL
jgi:hypothetical protein